MARLDRTSPDRTSRRRHRRSATSRSGSLRPGSLRRSRRTADPSRRRAFLKGRGMETGDGRCPPPVVRYFCETVTSARPSLLRNHRGVVRSELRGERGVGHVRTGRLRHRDRVADADLQRNLVVVAGGRLLANALYGVDRVVAADLGDERVVVTDRKRNGHGLSDIRLVLDTELARHRVVRTIAGAEDLGLLVDVRAVLKAGLERG